MIKVCGKVYVKKSPQSYCIIPFCKILFCRFYRFGRNINSEKTTKQRNSSGCKPAGSNTDFKHGFRLFQLQPQYHAISAVKPDFCSAISYMMLRFMDRKPLKFSAL